MAGVNVKACATVLSVHRKVLATDGKGRTTHATFGTRRTFAVSRDFHHACLGEQGHVETHRLFGAAPEHQEGDYPVAHPLFLILGRGYRARR